MKKNEDRDGYKQEGGRVTPYADLFVLLQQLLRVSQRKVRAGLSD